MVPLFPEKKKYHFQLNLKQEWFLCSLEKISFLQQYKFKLGLQMKIFIILDMKKNKIDNFSLKIIVVTSINT
jgi:hypothetical protein